MKRGLENEDGREVGREGRQIAADPADAGALLPVAASCFDAGRCPTSLEASSAWGHARSWRSETCDQCDCGVVDRVFDRGILDELASMLDDDELDSYLALLEPTVAPRVEKLVRQFEAGDATGIVETAHALAGGAACYGLSALSALARQVENGVRSEPREAIYRAISEASGLVEESLAAVFRWRCRFRADRAGGIVPSAAEACILTAAAGAT